LRLTLATVAADHGGELEAALEVLGLIALKGKVATADALHCNRRTVAAINAGGGDWCLARPANQGSLLSDAPSCFGKVAQDRPAARQDEAGHRRKETRTGTVISAKGLAEHHDFRGLEASGRIESRRETGGVVQNQTRHFALSWTPASEVFMATVRAYWETPNALHWQLDVSFREDAARNRKGNAPANTAILRRRALDLAQGHIQGLALDQTQAGGLERRISSQSSQPVRRRADQTRLPCFPRTDSSLGFSYGYAERREAVQDGDPDLKLRDLTIKVPRGQALARQFRFADLRFTQCILVSTRLRRCQRSGPPLSRWRAAPHHRRRIVRPKRLDARKASLRAIAPGVSGFHGLAFLRGGMMAAAPRAAMASWHVAGV